MRTTLTLDEDVAKLVQQEVRRSGEPVKQTINRLLRNGLAHEQNPVPSVPFEIRSKRLGFPKDWTSGCVEELMEMLEGPDHR